MLSITDNLTVLIFMRFVGVKMFMKYLKIKNISSNNRLKDIQAGLPQFTFILHPLLSISEVWITEFKLVIAFFEGDLDRVIMS